MKKLDVVSGKATITVPALIIIGDKDVISPEHAIELHGQIANSELAIIPGGHGEYIGEITTLKPDFKESDLVVRMIEKSLLADMRQGKSSMAYLCQITPLKIKAQTILKKDCSVAQIRYPTNPSCISPVIRNT